MLRYLNPIINNLWCFSQDIRLTCLWDCMHHATAVQWCLGVATTGTIWAYSILCHMHNIHSFSIWKESSQTSQAKRIKSKMYSSAISFHFYNILFLCDKHHLPRNSQFNFIKVCPLNNVICSFSSKSSPIVPYINSFLVKYLVWSNERWMANFLNLSINLSRSKPFKDTLRR